MIYVVSDEKKKKKKKKKRKVALTWLVPAKRTETFIKEIKETNKKKKINK